MYLYILQDAASSLVFITASSAIFFVAQKKQKKHKMFAALSKPSPNCCFFAHEKNHYITVSDTRQVSYYDAHFCKSKENVASVASQQQKLVASYKCEGNIYLFYETGAVVMFDTDTQAWKIFPNISPILGPVIVKYRWELLIMAGYSSGYLNTTLVLVHGRTTTSLVHTMFGKRAFAAHAYHPLYQLLYVHGGETNGL